MCYSLIEVILMNSRNGHAPQGIKVFDSGDIILTDANSAIDLAVNAEAQTGATKFVINKAMVSPDFFDLKTGIAGEILQKFTNYGFKMAIYGDFSEYASKALKDFIYESNNGDAFFFTPTKEDALRKLE